MATSINGFQVLESNRTTGSLPRLRKWSVPGTSRHIFLRDGSVGFILIHVAMFFHQKIEKLDEGVWDEWGWAVRPVRGSTTGYSNHASGTAEDLNATRHPLGVSIERTFTTAQIRKIRRRLRFFYRVVDWGGDWRRPDGMHFEIRPGITLSRCEKVAKRLMKTPRGRAILRANPGAKAVIES